MFILSYFLLFIMGSIVGLVGGGGAILTVPILVYLFDVDPILATFYSLVIVGSTALIGVFLKIPSKQINWKVGLIFGIPAIIATFISRHFIVPSIPNNLLGFEKGTILLLVFSVIMFFAGLSMIKNKENSNCLEKQKKLNLSVGKKAAIIILEGAIVGTVTGLVGAGGGFLIVPALIMLECLDIKEAASTSLLIIALKSLIGSLGDLSNTNLIIDTNFLSIVIVIAIVGLFFGVFFQKKVNAKTLSKGFGVFSMITAMFMVVKELLF